MLHKFSSSFPWNLEKAPFLVTSSWRAEKLRFQLSYEFYALTTS